MVRTRLEKKLANNHNYHLANFLSSLLVAQQKKKVIYTYWPSPKIVIAVAVALRDEGFIHGFTLNQEKNALRIEIYLKYHGSNLMPLISKLRLYASPSHPFNYTYKRLTKLVYRKTHIYFLSTIFGIKTSEYCLSNMLGGNLLFRIR